MKCNILVIVSLLFCLFLSCENEGTHEPWVTDLLMEYVVTPINGGAEIEFTLPKDPDIWYVMAEYERNGKIFTEKSSVYKNKLTIEGFHNVDNVKVLLYKVNRKEQKSEPVEVEFQPLESLVNISARSLKAMSGFGGFLVSWDNPKCTELGIRLLVPDAQNVNQWVTREMLFSTSQKEKHSFRGFDAEETTFGIVLEDKWGNISDTIFHTLTPLFEVLIPKPYGDYRAFIPYDNITTLGGNFPFSNLYDNIVNSAAHGWLTQIGSSGLSITFDMKQVVKLSRMIIHGYHINDPYDQVNISHFEAWGVDKIDMSKLSVPYYWLDEYSLRNGAIHGLSPAMALPERTFKDDWQYLGSHAITRYDLMTPPDLDGIARISQHGTEYHIPIEAKPVRYVRIFVRGVCGIVPPPSDNYFSMGEITFYGDNRVPQE